MVLSLIGCAKSPQGSTAEAPAAVSSATATPTVTPSVKVVADDKPITSRPPNEAGLIPILEYHRIMPKAGRYDRTVAQFKSDLERLHREGYRPVALEEMLSGKIDLPRGASPVVLTFDDADVSQFRYLLDGTIDPNCAVGILQSFQQKHADWKTRVTFYVLPENAFGPAKERTAKFRFLRDELGCEIGNHTITHPSLRSLSDASVQKEIGGCVQKIEAILPDTPVKSIALPMGISPRNKALLAKGTYSGQGYTHTSVLLVGANPAPSPYTKAFNPMRLPRIQAVEGDSGITDWLNRLKKPGTVYVSDGNPEQVTAPAKDTAVVTRLNGKKLVTAL